MRKMRLAVLCLCLVLLTAAFSGCGKAQNQSAGKQENWGDRLFDSFGKKDRIQLTEEQEAAIDMFIDYRDEWDEYVDFVDRVTANRLHVAEVSTKDGRKVYTFITVGYFKGNTFVARGYVASSTEFAYVDMAHKDWLSDCVEIDLENLSDEELREVLRESYIAYLEKQE